MHSLELTRKLTPGQEDALRKSFPNHTFVHNGEILPMGLFLKKIRTEKILLKNPEIVILQGLLDSIKYVPGGSNIAS